MEYFIIDAIAPFFLPCAPHSEQNWSKIPFTALERDNHLDKSACTEIEKAFDTFCATVSSMGYNAISLDDVAHLVNHECYPAPLSEKIEEYRGWYAKLFATARHHGLKIFVTTDILFFNESLAGVTGMRVVKIARLCLQIFRSLFQSFEFLEGVIIRIGETDGLDVQGDFISKLFLKTPRQCRRFLRAMLPLFERYEKQLVFRTWTLGAFEIGDLMWNRATWDKTFEGLKPDNLIISCKYGEADFYKYLNFNRLLFDTPQRKIIEFQARREYEGFGEIPSFVGYDYERYREYLNMCENIEGIMVWCQTGGWSHFTRLTFCRDSSRWNEINTFVTIKLFKDRLSVKSAIALFARERMGLADHKPLVDLVKTADQIIRELWYIPEFSAKRFYFRRVRVPPLLWIFWDTIIINHVMRKTIRRFVHERKESVHDGYRILYKVKQLREYATLCGIAQREIDYAYDTLALLAAAREYFLGEWKASFAQSLEAMAQAYRQKYPDGFHVAVDFKPTRLKKRLIKVIFKASLRTHPHYRLVDKFFFIRFASLIYPLIDRWQRRRAPSFVREQAMGVQVFFK